jgi:TonB family protein
VKLAWGSGYPAARTSMDLPVSKAVVAAIEDALGTPLVKMPTLGGSIPMYLFEDWFRVPVIGVPIANHDDNQHAANENLRLQNLWDGTLVFAGLLTRIADALDASGATRESSRARAVDALIRKQLEEPGLPQNQFGFQFDPESADFTAWVLRAKNQVYRNWIMPQAALRGARGRVELEFTVERNGTLSALRILRASGTPPLDEAAQKAISSSRFLPLPADYKPPRLPLQVSFSYNERP